MLLAHRNALANVRTLLVSPTRGQIAQWRAASTKYRKRSSPQKTVKSKLMSPSLLVADTEVAKQLHKTGIAKVTNWYKTHLKEMEKEMGNGPKLPPKTDRSRVNMVDERLCDDILSYHGDSLRRHEGCDIIDLFPGVGVWSTKLNDFLKPRSHLLLEQDKVYNPFLEPLLQRPGTRLVDKSGIEWKHLPQILNSEMLPHQVEQTAEYPPRRNDTLLVTANLSWYPPKRFQSFPSVTQLLLYQFVMAAQSSSWYQRYGLVRMLIWTTDEDKLSLLPRGVGMRRRLAISADLNTEWVVEVAGGNTAHNPKYLRDMHVDMESAQNTAERMQKQGIVMPPGREPKLHLDALSSKERIVAGNQPALYQSLSEPVLEALRAQAAALKAADKERDKELNQRISRAKYYLGLRERNAVTVKEAYDEFLDIMRQHRDATDDEGRAAAVKRAEALGAQIDRWNINAQKNWPPYRDNLRAFRQSPPVLQWDRRPFEPLQVKAEEFYPNVPCALLDIQPKAPHPSLWGRGTDKKAGMPDVWELIIQQLNTELNVADGLKRLHSGSPEDILPNCPSLNDPDLHGSPFHTRHCGVSFRSLNEAQLTELLEAWVASPFSPDMFELLRAGFGIQNSEENSEAFAGINPAGKMGIRNL